LTSRNVQNNGVGPVGVLEDLVDTRWDLTDSQFDGMLAAIVQQRDGVPGKRLTVEG
jgi:hypothetical protein